MSRSSATLAAVTTSRSSSSSHVASASPSVTDPEPTLVVEELRKSFGGSVAVADVSFDVGASDVVCLVGPSGCGKSTVLRMVAGLIRPDHGRVTLRGQRLDGGGVHVPPERRSIGIVFQDHALFPNLDVSKNVAFGLTALDRPDRRRRVGEMLELVGLGPYADRYPHELSGGERQRVALARALAPEPAVLLLDEPFASLDQNLRVKLRDDVLSILRETATPAVFVTHDQLEALSLGDRLLVLRDGRVEQAGTPEAVFHTPVSRFVATFMGEADFIPATVGDGQVTSELGARALGGETPPRGRSRWWCAPTTWSSSPTRPAQEWSPASSSRARRCCPPRCCPPARRCGHVDPTARRSPWVLRCAWSWPSTIAPRCSWPAAVPEVEAGQPAARAGSTSRTSAERSRNPVSASSNAGSCSAVTDTVKRTAR